MSAFLPNFTRQIMNNDYFVPKTKDFRYTMYILAFHLVQLQKSKYQARWT